MGRYINWKDVVDRYPQAETVKDASEISSAYIAYSENYVDGNMAPFYSVPFSESNAMLRDLCIDMTFGRIDRSDLERAQQIIDNVDTRIQKLRDGDMLMVTDAGEVIDTIVRAPESWSTTQSYEPQFGISPYPEGQPSRSRLNDEDLHRGG